jgi:[ribosomal protein S18]-alanine N-acetyltransferase
MIRLRNCKLQDLVGLHRLDQVCFSREIAYSKAELQYFLSHPKCSCWLAEQADNRLAGFVIIERASRNGSPAGHIITLDVDPSQRRHGLGTLLMRTAEEQMRQEGASVMSLEVAENNVAARQFYRGLGFVLRGKIAKYYGGTIDAEVMEKAI